MSTYLIHWKSTIYGTSTVVASSSEEARKLAEHGEDDEFDSNDASGYQWEIDEIEELSPDDIASQSSGKMSHSPNLPGSNVPVCSLCKGLQAAGVEEGRILDLHFNAAEPTKREREIMEQWADSLRGYGSTKMS